MGTSFMDPTGKVRPVQLEPDGSVPVSLGDLMLKIDELIREVRLLRLGLCAAPDSVCVDLEGELTPVTNSEE